MKYIFITLFILLLCNCSFGEEAITEDLSKEFCISKVNRIEKLWIVPPNRRDFLGSRGITKFDYGRPIKPEDRGEDYVVTWKYRGKEPKGNLILKFEYRTDKNDKELCKEEYTWPSVKRGSYRWTFKNIGGKYLEKGMVDRWKVSLISGDKVVAVKRSATWRAMEGT